MTEFNKKASKLASESIQVPAEPVDPPVAGAVDRIDSVVNPPTTEAEVAAY